MIAIDDMIVVSVPCRWHVMQCFHYTYKNLCAIFPSPRKMINSHPSLFVSSYFKFWLLLYIDLLLSEEQRRTRGRWALSKKGIFPVTHVSFVSKYQCQQGSLRPCFSISILTIRSMQWTPSHIQRPWLKRLSHRQATDGLRWCHFIQSIPCRRQQ